MIFNSNKKFFIFILCFSSLISISSNSWLGCWIGLEINLLSFIPIISNSKNLLTSEASLKYFLTQAIASINLLFIILLKMTFIKNFFNNFYFSMLINTPLLMKMGSAPFHFWIANIMEGLNWMNCFILMSWQKIAPMILISYYYNSMFLTIISIMNALIGAINGINQISLRKILAFSSINNLGWMIASIMISENLWMIYFLIYSILNTILCFMFYSINSFFINQIFFFKLNNMIKLIMFFNMMSLGGLPPFLGFFSKWMVINYLILNNFLLMIFFLIMSSLIMLFFYLRIMYASFMFNYMKLKWFKIKIKFSYFYIFNMMYFFSLFGLPISTFFFYI
uniref:NADH-ubiquinone oxidoreductase chain 2 n=1 Tax=Lyonetia clerkella TaxID=753195 RepID=A0A343XBM1_9NEOP|nr:NADH dehydrogenase subunit 2 [Lyonetia clerkella]AWK29926.1 NADH dehydrogenase subunit 2 [Lyonetia clerkella]